MYLDTNALIYLLEGHPQYGEAVASILETETAQGDGLVTSVVTITEFLAGSPAADASVLQQIPSLEFVGFDQALAEQAAILQRKHQSLRIGDAIHLATARQQEANTILTNDRTLAKVAGTYLSVKSVN